MRLYTWSQIGQNIELKDNKILHEAWMTIDIGKILLIWLKTMMKHRVFQLFRTFISLVCCLFFSRPYCVLDYCSCFPALKHHFPSYSTLSLSDPRIGFLTLWNTNSIWPSMHTGCTLWCLTHRENCELKFSEEAASILRIIQITWPWQTRIS